MSRQKGVTAMTPATPERNTYIAMLGSVVNVPMGEQMARVAAICSQAKMREDQLKTTRHRGRLKRWLAKQLAALFSNSAMELDPGPFEHFSQIMRAVKDHDQAPRKQIGSHKRTLRGLELPDDVNMNERTQHAKHPFHSKALLLADLIRRDLVGPLPITQKEFLRLLGVPEKQEHDDGSYERRELRRLGIRFAADKRGPKKGSGKGV